MIGWRSLASPALLLAGISAYYAVLGLVVLAPEGVYSGDIGVQYVQAQALIDNGFRSLALEYPGAFLDPRFTFFPLRPPFILQVGPDVHAIFPPALAVLQAAGVALAGIHGLILTSLAGGVVVLHCARRLVPPEHEHRVLIALGLASPLWFYAVSGWQHAAAMAFGAAGFLAALRGAGTMAPLLAGLWIGAGATLRDETVLLLPGAAAAIWFRGKAWRPLLLLVAGAAAALVAAAALEVAWFERPPATHLRHAVHMLQIALHTTSELNHEVPVLQPMTLRERYETVVWYWLFGYGNDAVLAAYLAGLAAALLARWKLRSSAPLAIWLLAVIGLAALDVWELVTAPKWLAGLHRVAPYLVFAVLPPPPGFRGDAGLLARVAPITLAAYLVIAFAGVDTTGGKALGPRLLLPLLPILAAAAIPRIWLYMTGTAPADRWTGRFGVALVVMALVAHTYGTTVAYVARNQDDAQLIRRVTEARERIVVADDPFTAQLLFPLYYRKIILLADSPGRAAALAAMMAEQRVPAALLVSRQPDPGVALTALQLRRREQRGRMYITYWTR